MNSKKPFCEDSISYKWLKSSVLDVMFLNIKNIYIYIYKTTHTPIVNRTPKVSYSTLFAHKVQSFLVFDFLGLKSVY